MHARSSPRHPKEETCEFGVKDDTGDHSERVIDLTPTRLDAYAQQRLAAGPSPSSVNYELASAPRAVRLPVEEGPPPSLPVIQLPAGHDPPGRALTGRPLPAPIPT